MKITKIRSATIFIAIITLAIVVSSNVSNVAADGTDLNLPSDPVTIEVFDGTVSYFETHLMDVPPGYDVTNQTYLGWCVDTRAHLERSPARHMVFLYSSLNPPGELASEEWDMVNYILNHKQGKEAMDIQEAIWYFIHMDESFNPTRPGAWDLINDAIANGNGFVPEYGQTVAVICYPTPLFPQEVQISIIEVQNTVIPEFPSIPIMLMVMLTTLFAAIIWKKKEAKV
ncbi:MAG: hypothetical protein QXR42_08135 [Candidatus Bathyarchaeia archaeon]